MSRFPLLLLAISAVANGQIKLPHLNIDPSKVTVSGASSGALMATQFHFAHSAEVKGAGIFAGGPYLCAIGSPGAAGICMLTPELVNIPLRVAEAKTYATAKVIDSTNNINGSKVFIFHGTKDTTVRPIGGKKTEQMYRSFGADIKTEFTIAGEHGQPTMDYGNPCGKSAATSYFMSNCSYDGAFEALNHLYGGDLIRPQKGTELKGDFNLFDQSEFFGLAPALSSMDSQGFVYVPSGCRDGTKKCGLHIAFHGCTQFRLLMGDAYPKHAGYREVAELNDIVVLFPNTVPIATNAAGCWDWFGYLLKPFSIKAAPQIAGVYRMMNRLVKG